MFEIQCIKNDWNQLKMTSQGIKQENVPDKISGEGIQQVLQSENLIQQGLGQEFSTTDLQIVESHRFLGIWGTDDGEKGSPHTKYKEKAEGIKVDSNLDDSYKVIIKYH